MNKDELELIKNLTKEKIAVSKFQEEIFMKRKNNKRFLFNTISTVAACLLLFSGIIYSKDMSKQLYAVYIKNNVTEVATVNAHTSKFDFEYEVSENEIINLDDNNQNLSQDALKIKVEEITMDDTSLDITFDASFNEEISKKINKDSTLEINMPDISITDENQNIIYCSNKDKICKILDLEYITDEEIDNDKYFNSNMISYVRTHDEKSAKIMFSLTLFEENRYLPRSKKLNINLDNIEIKSDINNEYGGTALNLKGNWNLDINLPENIYSRQRNIYKEAKENNTENKVLTCNVLSTWTEVTLQLKANEICKGLSPQLNLINAIEIGEPSTQIRDYFVDGLMASDEYKQYEEDLHKNYLIQEAYIEDENGNTYGLVKGPFSNAGGRVDDNWNYKPKLILDFKDVNMTDSLKLHVKYLDNEYVFYLVKEGKV